ncbi:MAG: chitobiase/beta-hexosaminidase C-terminal domain-containing protein [Muribaculaceae bacterium]|nr:chitobiase/beta-hexosaminidase C-terminal domain-containing protein [Muribaculaceae bacterium]
MTMKKVLFLSLALMTVATMSAQNFENVPMDSEVPTTPTFHIPGGYYIHAVPIRIACSTEGAEIHYTLDGTTPTEYTALYTGQFTISHSTTIKAVAVKDGVSSSVAVEVYIINTGVGYDELTLIWEQKFASPAATDARFATGFDGAIYAAQKATADAAGKILKYTEEGVTTFATVEGMGTAITSDDAGNILVNKGFPGVGSSTSWGIIEPNGTQHELTLTLPDGIEACRVDQVGRVVGNVMSADGGYMFIAGNGQSAVAAIKIVNGEQDISASAASPTVAVTMNTSTLAQPMFETVEETEAFVDPSAAFYSRNRGLNTLFSWMEDGSEQYAIDNSFGAGGNEGFDVFKLNGVPYGVVSLARTTEFAVRDIVNKEQVATGGSAEETVGLQFHSYTARPKTGGIYVWNAGHSARYYTFGVPMVKAPKITPLGGSYSTAQEVTITCATPGAEIRYTLDNEHWETYNGPITISETATLNAIADKDGFRQSEKVTAIYKINHSGVECESNDALEVATTYYNLQGVRIDNPSAGQIYIRVATLSDGSVRTSKVVVK